MEAGLRDSTETADRDIDVALLVSPKAPRGTARPSGDPMAQRITFRVADSRLAMMLTLVRNTQPFADDFHKQVLGRAPDEGHV